MLARQSHSVSLTAVVASVLHSVIVQTVLALPSFSTPVYEVGYGGRNSAFVQSTVVAITLFASLLLYLYTGVPNIFTKRCDTCGEVNVLGGIRCHNCGTVRGVESFSLQAAWLVIGYSTISVLSLYFLVWPTLVRSDTFEFETFPYLLGYGIVLDYVVIAFAWLLFLVVSANIAWYVSVFRGDMD